MAIRLLCDIGLKRDRRPTIRSYAISQDLGRGAIDQNEVGAESPENPRCCLADAARRTDDQGPPTR